MTADIRQFNYYANKNHFYGSYKGLNFHVAPGEEFTVEAWLENVCSTLAQNKETAQFPFTEEGLEQVREWLCERFRQRDALEEEKKKKQKQS